MLHVRPVNTLPNTDYWLRYLTAGPQNQRCSFQGHQPLEAPAFTSAIQRFRSVSASKYMASSSADLTQTRLQKTAQFAIRDQKCPWTFMDTNKLGLKLNPISSWKWFISCLSKASDFRALALSTKIPVTWMAGHRKAKTDQDIGGRTKQTYDTNQWVELATHTAIPEAQHWQCKLLDGRWWQNLKASG